MVTDVITIKKIKKYNIKDLKDESKYPLVSFSKKMQLFDDSINHS